MMTDTVQATNEELRSKLMDVQTELQQERGKVRGKKVQTTKSIIMVIALYCAYNSSINFKQIFSFCLYASPCLRPLKAHTLCSIR